jgi:hypothetical protein
MAYKMDNLRYGAMDDSYLDSMAEANDNSQDAQRWKLLADQAMKDNSLNTTNEGDAYRQKELLAIRAKKKKIIQEIDELKKVLQQRTQLQAFEDKYKDSPFWKLAKKNYIDTGDMGAIESFINRENALQEAKTNREFTREQNELNRSNTFELNKAQKTEQLEYDLDDAQAKVELAQNKLKSANALGVPVDIKDAQIAFNSAVNRLNKIREKLGMEASEYELEEYADVKSSGKNESSDNNERTLQDILENIPKNFSYKTNDEKAQAMKEISEHSAYKNQIKEIRDAYTKIRDTKTQEQIKADKDSSEKKAKALWNSLSRADKYDYLNGIIPYDSNNPDHVLLNNKFGIQWGK